MDTTYGTSVMESGALPEEERTQGVEWVVPEIEFLDEVGGFYFRSYLLKNAGDCVLQHVHDHDHVTYIGNGAVLAFADTKRVGTFPAGHAIEIKAGVEHSFQALQRNTRITCVHNVASADSLKDKGL